MTDGASAEGGRRRRLLVGVTVAIAVAALAALADWWIFYRSEVSTDDAYVKGYRVLVTPEESGTVSEIAVDTTDRVTAGMVVVRLDPTNALIALKGAEAGLAEAVRQARGRYARVAALEAELRAAQSARSQAARDASRSERLLTSGITSQASNEQALNQLALDRDRVASARAALARAHSLTHGLHVAEQPLVTAAETHVEMAAVALARCEIASPVSGYVAKRPVELGEAVRPGTPLLVIVPLSHLWVDANFKERELREVRIGQPVRLTTDWYGPDVVFHGRVLGIAPGSGSAFSLLPPENASGNWIKVVQRVPVRVSIDPRDLARHPLRIGLSVTARISLTGHHKRELAIAAPASVSQSTPLYGEALAGADRLIADIIRTNLPK